MTSRSAGDEKLPDPVTAYPAMRFAERRAGYVQMEAHSRLTNAGGMAPLFPITTNEHP